MKASHPIKADEAYIASAVADNLTDEGWDVYAEVRLGAWVDGAPNHGICDLVAVRGPLAMFVECKRSLSFDLFEQAAEWTRFVPLVAVATFSDASNRTEFRKRVASHFGFGLARVLKPGAYTMHPWIVRPRLLRHNLRNVARIREALSDAMRLSTAGASATYRHTPYQNTMNEIRAILATAGPLPIRDLLAYLERTDTYGQPRHHYSSRASLAGGLAKSIGAIEPDIRRRGDIVSWHPEDCRRDGEYIAYIQRLALIRCAELHTAPITSRQTAGATQSSLL